MTRTPLQRRTRGAYRRAGFTLVELLIVISIIGILAALSIGAAMMLMGTQKKNNTTLVLQKTADALDQQWKAVVDQAKNESITAGELALAQGNPSSPSPDYQRRARVIHIYLKLRQEFPVTYAEAVTPILIPGAQPMPPKNAYVKALPFATATTPPSVTQSSACLLLALSQPRRGMSFNADQALGSGAIQDTDNDGIREIIDGWGRPLGFWRWPSDSSLPGDPAWKALFPVNSAGNPTNPLDPEGLLLSPSWNGTSGQQTFLSLCGGGYTSPTPSRPVVGSAGPDGVWGLDIPPPLPGNIPGGAMKPDGSGNDNDNLYSYRLSLGGKGD